MDEADKKETTAPVGQAEEQSRPELPVGFFQDLLQLPSCKTIGVCDNCGRCER